MRPITEKKKLMSDYIYNKPDMGEFKDYYTFQASSATDDVKFALLTALNDVELTIILYYAESGNMRQTASKFMVSVGTIHKKIHQIQTKIKNRLKEIQK